MTQADEIIGFLDATIQAGGTKAYLSAEDEGVLAGGMIGYNYRRYRTTNPMGKYRRKLVIMRLKEEGK